MRTLFLESRYTKKVVLPKDLILRLKGRIGLFTAVQFLNSLEDIQKQLKIAGRTVRLFRTRHTKHNGQTLGCNIQEFEGIDSILYIGDGLFHPHTLALKNRLPVLAYNPFNCKFTEIDDRQLEKLRQKQLTALKKFYISEDIGILVSTKYGQNRLKDAIKLKKRLDKRYYILMSNDIDYSSLENFSFIGCFVNTACPRIAVEDSISISKPIINIDEIKQYL